LYIWISKLFGMSNHFNKKETNLDLNKVEEPIAEYSSEKTQLDSELISVLNQMLKIGLKQIELGQTKPHEQVMTEMKLKYNFK